MPLPSNLILAAHPANRSVPRAGVSHCTSTRHAALPCRPSFFGFNPSPSSARIFKPFGHLPGPATPDSCVRNSSSFGTLDRDCVLSSSLPSVWLFCWSLLVTFSLSATSLGGSILIHLAGLTNCGCPSCTKTFVLAQSRQLPTDVD